MSAMFAVSVPYTQAAELNDQGGEHPCPKPGFCSNNSGGLDVLVSPVAAHIVEDIHGNIARSNQQCALPDVHALVGSCACSLAGGALVDNPCGDTRMSANSWPGINLVDLTRVWVLVDKVALRVVLV